MDGHVLSLIGIVVVALAALAMNALLYVRVIKVENVLQAMLGFGGLISECRDHARSVAQAVVNTRQKQLDEQEFKIHKEMGNLNRVLFSATSMLKEFLNINQWGGPYESGPGGDRHSPGSGGAPWEPGDQDNLPTA